MLGFGDRKLSKDSSHLHFPQKVQDLFESSRRTKFTCRYEKWPITSLLWDKKDYAVAGRFPSCVKKKKKKEHRFDSSLVVDGVSLSKPMNPFHFPEALFQSWPCTLTSWWRAATEQKIPPLGDQYLEKKGDRCSLCYLLLQYREVRTQGQLKSSTLGADRDSASCSRTLQQAEAWAGLQKRSRVPTVPGRGPLSPQHPAALKEFA